MASRHSVISRKDNIILSPDGLEGFDNVDALDPRTKNFELSPNSMALRLSTIVQVFNFTMHLNSLFYSQVARRKESIRSNIPAGVSAE